MGYAWIANDKIAKFKGFDSKKIIYRSSSWLVSGQDTLLENWFSAEDVLTLLDHPTTVTSPLL